LFSASSSPIGAEKQQQFQEYLTAKSKILSQAAYCVCFSSPHSENVPKTIRTEVLTGILEEWARSSEKKRYVKKYPIAAIDKTFFDDLSLDKEEPILRLLKLRAISRNIENTIDFLGTYRGAVDVKTASGTNILSLQTIVNNVIRNKIPLLAGTVRNGRLYKNFIISSQYVKASLFDLRLDEEMQKERVAQAKKVQESYLNNVSPLTSDSISSPARDSVPFTGMLIPQIGETFLDRLIKLSQESQDTKYRQSLSDRIIEEGVKLLDIQQDIAFYQNLLPKEISKGTTPPETLEQHKRHSNIFEGRFRDAIEQLRQVNRELIIIRDLLSDIQLEANSKLYRVLGDVEHQSVSRMSPKKTIFLVILMIFLFYCFSSFGVLGLEYFQKKE